MKNVTKKNTFLKNAGDKLERIAEKISSKDPSKVGNALYDIGNKLEHAGEDKIKPVKDKI